MRAYQLSAIALVASLLCGTANAQSRGGPWGDLEEQNHEETMRWLDRRYDQTMQDMQREQLEERLKRLEDRPIYYAPIEQPTYYAPADDKGRSMLPATRY